jgi:hypothetical protein
MMQGSTPQPRAPAPVPAQPAVPPDLGQTIQQSVEQAVRDAMASMPSNLSASERSRMIRDRVRTAVDQARASADAARAGSTTIAQIPFDPSNMIPPQAVDMAYAFFITVAVIAIGIPLARAIARWIDRRGHVPSAPPDLSPRLDRIEQAIEAVAIEVERVSEGQRFTTRLMSEMRSLPAPNPLEAGPIGNSRKAEPLRPAVAEPSSA